MNETTNHLLGVRQMNKQANTPDELMLIGAIRQYANTLYNEGWDLIVEAYDDGDLLEELSENGMDLAKTLKSLQTTIDLRKEMSDNCQF
jgi:hypothetical protein